jgi:hypothetical protein
LNAVPLNRESFGKRIDSIEFKEEEILGKYEQCNLGNGKISTRKLQHERADEGAQ